MSVARADSDDREQLLARIEAGNWTALDQADRVLRADRRTVLAAVRVNGRALFYAAAQLRADHEVVLAAVQQDPVALQYAAGACRGHRPLVLQVVAIDGRALEFASARLRADVEVVERAARSNGEALQFASAELRDNKAVVLAAVAQLPAGRTWQAHGVLGGGVVQYASPRLQADKEVALVAVARRPRASWAALGPSLRQDPDVMLAAVRGDPHMLLVFPDQPQVLDNRELVLAAAEQHGWLLSRLPAAWRSDRGVVLAAVANDPRVLRFAAAELRDDRAVVLSAVRSRGAMLEFASAALQADREVVLAALAVDWQAIRFAAEVLRGDGEVVLAAVAIDSRAFGYGTAALRNDLATFLTALTLLYHRTTDDIHFRTNWMLMVPLGARLKEDPSSRAQIDRMASAMRNPARRLAVHASMQGGATAALALAELDREWRPHRHRLFPARARDAVNATLLVAHRLGRRAAAAPAPRVRTRSVAQASRRILPVLPDELWLSVMRFYLREDWALDSRDDTWEEAEHGLF